MENVDLSQGSREHGFTNNPKPYYVVEDVSRLRFFLSLDLKGSALEVSKGFDC